MAEEVKSTEGLEGCFRSDWARHGMADKDGGEEVEGA